VDFPGLLGRIAAPALVLRADPVVGGALDDAGRDLLAAALPPARLRLVDFPGTGHLIHAEQPDRFAAAVEAFLEVPATGSAR
jgi:3-oxoadipate enol-lactonase